MEELSKLQKEYNELKETHENFLAEYNEFRTDSKRIEDMLDDEVAQKDERISELEKMIDDLKSKHQTSVSENKNLEKEINKLETQISKENISVKDIRHSLVNKELENEDMSGKLRNLEFDYSNLESKFAKMEEELIITQQMLEKEKSDSNDKIKTLEENLKDFQNQVLMMKRKSIECEGDEEMVKIPAFALETMEKMVTEKEEELSAIKKKLKSQENDFKEIQKSLESELTKSSKPKKKSFSSDESESETEEMKRIDILTKENVRLNELILENQTQMDNYLMIIHEKEQNIEALQKDTSKSNVRGKMSIELTSEVDVLNEKLKILTAQNKALEEKLEENNLNYENNLSKVRDETNKLKTQLESGDANEKQFENTLREFQNEIIKINETLDEEKELKEEFKLKNEKLERQIGELLEIQRETDNSCIELKIKLEEIDKEYKEKSKDLESNLIAEKQLTIENQNKIKKLEELLIEESANNDIQMKNKLEEIEILKSNDEKNINILNELEQFKISLLAKENEISNLQASINEQNIQLLDQSSKLHEIEILKSHISELEIQISNKNEDLETKEKEIDRLNKMMIDVNEAELDIKNGEIKKLREKIEKLESDYLNNEIKQNSEKDITSREELEEKIERAKEAQRQAETELGNFNIYLENMELQLNSEKLITEEQKLEIEKLQKEILELKSSLVANQESNIKLEDYEIQINILKQKETELNYELQESKNQIDCLTENVQILTLNQIQDRNNINMEENVQPIDNEEKIVLKELLTSKNIEIEDMKDKISEFISKIEKQESLIREKANEIENLKEKVCELDNSLTIRENQLQQLNETLNARRESRVVKETVLKEESKTVKNNMNVFKQEYNKIVKSLNDQLKASTTEIEELKEELKSTKEQLKTSKKLRESLKEQITELNEKEKSILAKTPSNKRKVNLKLTSPSRSQYSPQNTISSPKSESTQSNIKVNTYLYVKCAKYFFCPYIDIQDKNHVIVSKTFMQKAKGIPLNTELKKLYFEDIWMKPNQVESKLKKILLQNNSQEASIIIYGHMGSQKSSVKQILLELIQDVINKDSNSKIMRFAVSLRGHEICQFKECIWDGEDNSKLISHIEQLKGSSIETENSGTEKNEENETNQNSLDIYTIEFKGKKINVVCSNIIKKSFKFSENKDKIIKEILGYDYIQTEFEEILGNEFFSGMKHVILTVNPSVFNNRHREALETLSIVPYLQKQDRIYNTKGFISLKLEFNTTSKVTPSHTFSHSKGLQYVIFDIIQESKPLKEQINQLKKENDDLKRTTSLCEKQYISSQIKIKEMEKKLQAMASKMQTLVQSLSKIASDPSRNKKKTLMRVPTTAKLERTALAMRKMIDEALYSNLNDKDSEKTSRYISSPNNPAKYTATKEDDEANLKANIQLDKAIMKINSSSDDDEEEDNYQAENENESELENEKEPERVQLEDKKTSIAGKKASVRGSIYGDEDEVL